MGNGSSDGDEVIALLSSKCGCQWSRTRRRLVLYVGRDLRGFLAAMNAVVDIERHSYTVEQSWLVNGGGNKAVTETDESNNDQGMSLMDFYATVECGMVGEPMFRCEQIPAQSRVRVLYLTTEEENVVRELVARVRRRDDASRMNLRAIRACRERLDELASWRA